MANVPNQRSLSIEFIVKPRQNLHLEGTLRNISRVLKGVDYPCQMQKTQNFSCLFRHYAKHNGLRKEDLVFSFVDELLPDQTPETVHLMPGDEIWVEHRVPEPIETKVNLETTAYSEQFRVLLDSAQHSDITFIVGDSNTELQAHKCILSARSEYFDAMFRIGGMSESQQETVVYKHDSDTFRRMLEFLYTDSVKDLDKCTGAEVLSLLVISNEFLVQNLRELCETFAAKVINKQNVSKFLLLSSNHNGSVLRAACARFVQDNMPDLALDYSFRQEVERCPELGLLLLEAALPTSETIPGYSQDGNGRYDNAHKRRRVTNEANAEIELDNTVGGGGGGGHHGMASNTIAQNNANVQDY